MIVPAAALTIFGHAVAANAFSMPPSWMPMTMLVVSFDAATQKLGVQDQTSAVLLAYDTDSMGVPNAAATAFAQYDPAQPWSVLQDSAFSRRLGWWAGTGSAPAVLQSSVEAAYGTGASIWIESVSQSAGLDTYLAIGKYGVNANNTTTVDPAALGYTGIFGTGGSSTRWEWDYQMDHNTYAVPWAHLSPNQQYTATYKVFIGDSFGNELAAATGASTVETWTWNAPAVMPVPEPTTCGLMMAGLGLLGFANRRRNAKSCKTSVMRGCILITGLLSMIGGAPAAEASVITYDVVATFHEPDTQPNDTIFTGSFTFDDVTLAVSNLHGFLTESMTGMGGMGGGMTELELNYQLSSVYDAALGGLLVTTFLNDNTNTLSTLAGGNGWAPGSAGGLYYGYPGSNPGNAYAMIFVNTTNPLTPLTQAQIDKLAYADCAPGGMMGATCMTGTTVAGYGEPGSMGGYPVSQTITMVPEPGSCLMVLSGLGILKLIDRRRVVAS